MTHYAGGPTYEATLTQTIHPSGRLELELVTDLAVARGAQHWLETQGDTPIVGLRRLINLGQSVRASYAFTPSLTLQAYAQLLVATWHFRDLASYVDDDTLAPGAMAEITSFSANSFNLNAVLRWEILPGSTLYAVYTHGAFERSETGGGDPGGSAGGAGGRAPRGIDAEVFHRDATLSSRSVSALLRAPADDVVQLKLAWMFR